MKQASPPRRKRVARVQRPASTGDAEQTPSPAAKTPQEDSVTIRQLPKQSSKPRAPQSRTNATSPSVRTTSSTKGSVRRNRAPPPQNTAAQSPPSPLTHNPTATPLRGGLVGSQRDAPQFNLPPNEIIDDPEALVPTRLNEAVSSLTFVGGEPLNSVDRKLQSEQQIYLEEPPPPTTHRDPVLYAQLVESKTRQNVAIPLEVLPETAVQRRQVSKSRTTPPPQRTRAPQSTKTPPLLRSTSRAPQSTKKAKKSPPPPSQQRRAQSDSVSRTTRMIPTRPHHQPTPQPPRDAALYTQLVESKMRQNVAIPQVKVVVRTPPPPPPHVRPTAPVVPRTLPPPPHVRPAAPTPALLPDDEARFDSVEYATITSGMDSYDDDDEEVQRFDTIDEHATITSGIVEDDDDEEEEYQAESRFDTMIDEHATITSGIVEDDDDAEYQAESRFDTIGQGTVTSGFGDDDDDDDEERFETMEQATITSGMDDDDDDVDEDRFDTVEQATVTSGIHSSNSSGEEADGTATSGLDDSTASESVLPVGLEPVSSITFMESAVLGGCGRFSNNEDAAAAAMIAPTAEIRRAATMLLTNAGGALDDEVRTIIGGYNIDPKSSAPFDPLDATLAKEKGLLTESISTNPGSSITGVSLSLGSSHKNNALAPFSDDDDGGLLKKIATPTDDTTESETLTPLMSEGTSSLTMTDGTTFGPEQAPPVALLRSEAVAYHGGVPEVRASEVDEEAPEGQVRVFDQQGTVVMPELRRQANYNEYGDDELTLDTNGAVVVAGPLLKKSDSIRVFGYPISSGKVACLGGCLCILMVVVIAVGVGLGLGLPSREEQPDRSIGVVVGGQKLIYSCLESNLQLQRAVDTYLAIPFSDENTTTANATNMTAAFVLEQFGPIDGWCLGPNVTSMNALFSARRNPYAAYFKEGNLSRWNTSSVTDMSDLFWGATQFAPESLEWNTSHVTSMAGMFAYASQFNAPLGAWDTSRVTAMQDIFLNATSFNQPLSGWNVTLVQNWTSSFRNARSFHQDLCSWYTQNAGIAPTRHMFTDTNCLTESDPIANGPWFCASCQPGTWPRCFDSTEELYQAVDSYMSLKLEGTVDMTTSQVAQVYGYPMRHWCVSRLTNLDNVFSVPRNHDLFYFNEDLSGWDTSSVVSMRGIFSSFPEAFSWGELNSASHFNSDISMWNVSSVTDMSFAFTFSSSFDQPLGTWDVTRVTNMEHMLEASGLSHSLANWNVARVHSMQYLFSACSNFNQPLNTWQVGSVRNMTHMFSGATAFDQTLDSWNVGNVHDMDYMFAGSAFNQPLDAWNVTRVESARGMFEQTSSFNKPLDQWQLNSLINMQRLFRNARAFNAPLFRLPPTVTDLMEVFMDATSFNHPSIQQWDVSRVTDMRSLFELTESFNVNVNGWNTASLRNVYGLFMGAKEFNQPLDNWDMSRVTSLDSIFHISTVFNQNINNWNVSGVTKLRNAFEGALDFNQPLSRWDVSRVEDMRFTFHNASSFDQDLSNWQVQRVENLKGCFAHAKSYRQGLCAWATRLPSNAKVKSMFDQTRCPDKSDPILGAVGTPTSFCRPCV